MGEFGNPITDETLKALPEYEGKEIGPVDRARVALNLKNAEGKDVRALQYAENLKATSGVNIVTACLVYNATGDTVEYAGHRDWSGRLGSAPYPTMIQNGQWGVFLHRQIAGSNFGCSGAVVYRGTNAANKDCDWILAWNNPFTKSDYENSAYTEVRDKDKFSNAWGVIHSNLSKSNLVDKSNVNGCLSFVTIGNESYSLFRAILTLENAKKNTR